MTRASIAYAIASIAVASYAPYLLPYYRSLGIGLGEIGLLAAFTSFVAFVSAPAWGAVHDRFPQSRALLPAAALLAAGGAAGLAAVGNSPLIVLAVATFAVGFSGTYPMMDVRVLDMTRSEPSRYAHVRVWGSASFMVSAPLIGFVVDVRGAGGFFLTMVPVLLLTSVAVATFRPRTNAVRAPGLRAPGRVLRDRPIALFLAGSLVAWAAISAQTAFFSIYLKDLGAPSDQVGWAWSIAAVLEIPVMLLYPRLARRFGTERLLVAGAAITVVRQVANVAFTTPALLIGFSLLQGAGYALLFIGGVTFVSSHAPKGTAATAQGILSGVTVSLASILGSGLGGVGASILTIRGLYALSAAVGGVAVVLIALAVLPVAGAAVAANVVADPAGAEPAGAEAIGPLGAPVLVAEATIQGPSAD